MNAANWFTQARFGMFVHWGLYSLAGGSWKGMETPWVSEWMMQKFRIPRAEYSQLANKFQAERFDADTWVKTALDAGMKYMVVTSKHHDGFAMFHSSYDSYNITDATPFHRDPMAELAAAAQKHGLKLGFYYSHEQDWNEPGAVGNTWDFRPEEKSDAAFDAYLNGKVRHQVRELLTNYGSVSILWFDTPVRITPEQSSALRQFVRKLSPDTLVNSRVGGPDEWDFESLADNQIPSQRFTRPTEGIGTMNESWGYKPTDHGYRTSDDILEIMGKLAACGANYMLNIGPDGSGAFPVEACKILKDTGIFLRKNGEALYGTSSIPVIYSANRWGQVTVRENRIYFWIFRNPGELRFYGIRTAVRHAHILGGEAVSFHQDANLDYDFHRLTLHLPKAKQGPFVVCAECGEIPDFRKDAYSCGQ